jgi:hypothetical protein
VCVCGLLCACGWKGLFILTPSFVDFVSCDCVCPVRPQHTQPHTKQHTNHRYRHTHTHTHSSLTDCQFCSCSTNTTQKQKPQKRNQRLVTKRIFPPLHSMHTHGTDDTQHTHIHKHTHTHNTTPKQHTQPKWFVRKNPNKMICLGLDPPSP